MNSNLALPGGCRVVRSWGVAGGAWNVAVPVAWTIVTLGPIFVGLLLLSAGSAALRMSRGGEAFELGPFLRGLLTFLVLALLIGASAWVFHRRKVLRQRRAEAAGEEAAYALACVAEPEALTTHDGEKLARWMTEFRRASRDVLLLDEASAIILMTPGDDHAPEQVVLRGVPRTVAVPFIVLIVVGIAIAMCVRSNSWLELIVGLTMDVGAAAWTIYAILGRERRIGGDRFVRPGQFAHGATTWSPPEAVLKIRRFSLGLFAWFSVWTIGPRGFTRMLVADRPDSRRSLREAIHLWTQPAALAADPGASLGEG
jgi:hypothetical protein